MRAQEIIQAILSVIDQTDKHQVQQEPVTTIQVDAESEPETAADFYDDEIRRMKQIAGLRDPGELNFLSNAPNPQYAPVSAVTTDAGGGPNKPKHVDDIRGNSFRVHGNN